MFMECVTVGHSVIWIQVRRSLFSDLLARLCCLHYVWYGTAKWNEQCLIRSLLTCEALFYRFNLCSILTTSRSLLQLVFVLHDLPWGQTLSVHCYVWYLKCSTEAYLSSETLGFGSVNFVLFFHSFMWGSSLAAWIKFNLGISLLCERGCPSLGLR